MSANPKVAAQELYAVARERHIKLPKVWDEATCIRNCGAIIVSAYVSLVVLSLTRVAFLLRVG